MAQRIDQRRQALQYLWKRCLHSDRVLLFQRLIKRTDRGMQTGCDQRSNRTFQGMGNPFGRRQIILCR